MAIQNWKNYRRIKKLWANPNLFFYNYFSRRLGMAPIANGRQASGSTVGEIGRTQLSADPWRALAQNIELPVNPWRALADTLYFRSGVLTGEPDQSLLLNANKLRWLIGALFDLAAHHNIVAQVYTLAGAISSTIDAKTAKAAGVDQGLYQKLVGRSDFVVELRGPNLLTVAAHVFLFDPASDGNATVRSTRAHVKKFRLDSLEEVYPKPIFGRSGSIVAVTSVPIDAVYTWVDKQDSQWQAHWAATFPSVELDDDRYTSHQELLYSIRSVAKYAPWVRKVFVVSNCARPSYLASDSPVVWVDHAEIFPAPESLPTFNSHAIEACLHRIPNLSEHFIYFNDDMVLNQPCTPLDFFDEHGRSKAYLEPYGMVCSKGFGATVPDYLQAARNSQVLLSEIGARGSARQLHQHTPYALCKSLLAELEEQFLDQFAVTRAAKLRSPLDINVTSFLFHHYALSEGRAVVAETKSALVRPRNVSKVVGGEAELTFQFLCFNDGEQSSKNQEYKQKAAAFFARRFGEISFYEVRVSLQRPGGGGGASDDGQTGTAGSQGSVLTYGTFDVFTDRHVQFLQRARSLGTRLIVGLASDDLVRQRAEATLLNYEQRKAVVESCKFVDMVIPAHADQQSVSDVHVHDVAVLVVDEGDEPAPAELAGLCRIERIEAPADVSLGQMKRALTRVRTGDDERLRWSGAPTVNFVYLAASDNLRSLEEDLSAGIVERLPDFQWFKRLRTQIDNAVNVTFWVNRPANVFLSHGCADKNYFIRRKNGERCINKYERVLVPGAWMKRKLLATKGVELDAAAIDVVGWPRLDRLLEQIKQRPAALTEGRRLKVLWAPTHAGRADASSYPALEQHAELLSSLFDYEVSTHPNTRGGGKPTFEKLLDADVVIADQGTMLYEAWALGKAVVCPAWLVKEGIELSLPRSAEAHIYSERIGNHASSFDELVDMIRAAPPPDERVKAFLADYLAPESMGRSFESVAQSIRHVWRAHAGA